MVEVIREKVIPFYSEVAVNGIYIFKGYCMTNMVIPQLPVLYETENSNIFLIKSPTQENIEISSKSLSKHFAHGDIIELNYHTKTIKNVLSSLSNENTLLLTEQCENRCLFCSQPPNDLPDTHLYQKATLALLNYNSQQLIGLTGGEPTINKDAFIGLMSALNQFGNNTPLHILSNGRNLGDYDFFEKLIGETNNREIIWGIPLYGHTSSLHNMIVGIKEAFSNTLEGLLNLSTTRHTIELRIVVVKQNYRYIKNILAFINSNFPVIKMISIMKLEPMGWARKNYEDLYVSVDEQNNFLHGALTSFNLKRFDIKLLNYPLCLLHEGLRDYAVKSISDWKNYYPDECNKCLVRENCCGYFSSSVNSYYEKPKAML
ncbi:MAG: His-Xaa-Ser system radical SAM maturase HxsC [Sulfurovum sp.]|nr:His-Xaa-Ser system radical SAM maturase HxsC [Sulfurovum sp.]MCB4764136.1 His-Xaa-Ser system radical SAM maturase HxsC [Sulfurovum sp.]MCB4766511.1 His-Xaa-Ser system radical SAM maturase HxsC [Sulfurovum sp.]MCB4773278.1 His-Xaa-Ser system radical SAM maturase HxsC [Sulfurovum sp.]MCB4774002.1 His-Xaa-Ser system radical SAM maturase HxsC [Sulfurovum sp.]